MIKDLTENQYKILNFLHDEEWCYPYAPIEEETKLPRSILEKEVKVLREAGLVSYIRGLVTEEGNFAGSGFCRTEKVDALINKYEETNHNMVKDCDCPNCKAKKCTMCLKVEEGK